jgi:hypothetical protein
VLTVTGPMFLLETPPALFRSVLSPIALALQAVGDRLYRSKLTLYSLIAVLLFRT